MNFGIHREKNPEKLVKLSTLKPGDIFRFQGVTFEDALANRDDACLYMVINYPKVEADRVGAVSMDGKIVLVRDGSHLVHEEPGATLTFPKLGK